MIDGICDWTDPRSIARYNQQISEYTIQDISDNGGLFDIQRDTVVGELMNGAYDNEQVCQFGWEDCDTATKQKLLPFLQQTIKAFFEMTSDYEYLFCSVQQDGEYTNKLIRLSDYEWIDTSDIE
jgi:hypothetical protein|tara:strand:+ start:479 stop:850 length:372 start_codon:yes stop_codon:yes gene_type:complete